MRPHRSATSRHARPARNATASRAGDSILPAARHGNHVGSGLGVSDFGVRWLDTALDADLPLNQKRCQATALQGEALLADWREKDSSLSRLPSYARRSM